jgi:hypothetical protein
MQKAYKINPGVQKSCLIWTAMIADGIFNPLYRDKTALRGIKQNSLHDLL